MTFSQPLRLARLPLRSVARSSCIYSTHPGLMAVRFMASAPSSQDAAPLKKTGLYDFHVQNGAKMVPFAGFEMPLTYDGTSHLESHNHVRNSVGLFDVGHMVQHYFKGPGATAFLEWLTPSSLNNLAEFSSTLSVLLTPSGGILDDTIITKHTPDLYYVVTNAGRRNEDLAWFAKKLEEWNAAGKDKVEHEVLENWGLVALQGPKAAEYLSGFIDGGKGDEELKALTFGKSKFLSVAGKKVHVARGGYTGEDGFEISISPEQTVDFTSKLLKFPVQLSGLAARDSLRLEAGLCLYGNDLDETTSPVEAGLTWLIGKDRREPGSARAEFVGAERVLKELKGGVVRKRVGFVVEGPPAREGAPIFPAHSSTVATTQIGLITSGIPSPTLGQNIAMGYISTDFSKQKTEVDVEIRGKRRKAVVTKVPFVPTKYFRG